MDVSSNLKQALAYQSQAEDALKRWWSTESTRLEKAATLYDKAANSYKLSKSWDNAGSTYERLAGCHLKLQSNFEAAAAYADAAHCYLKMTQEAPDDHGAVEKAISSLNMAAGIYAQDGNCNMAAKCCKEIAERYESTDMMKSIPHYERAVDLFEADKGHASTANQCIQKVAELAAKTGQYDKAIGLYEKVAEYSLKSNLLKYGVAGHFLNAGICHLCKNNVDAFINALEKYQDLDPTFSKSKRECLFLWNLSEAMQAGDADKFEEVVMDYNSMLPLDEWKKTLLQGVKDKLKASELEEEDLT